MVLHVLDWDTNLSENLIKLYNIITHLNRDILFTKNNVNIASGEYVTNTVEITFVGSRAMELIDYNNGKYIIIGYDNSSGKVVCNDTSYVVNQDIIDELLIELI
jgi:hypothetical protein